MGGGRARGNDVAERSALRSSNEVEAKELPSAARTCCLSDALTQAGIESAHVLLPITYPYLVHRGGLGSIPGSRYPQRTAPAPAPLGRNRRGRGRARLRAGRADYELPRADLVVCADAGDRARQFGARARPCGGWNEPPQPPWAARTTGAADKRAPAAQRNCGPASFATPTCTTKPLDDCCEAPGSLRAPVLSWPEKPCGWRRVSPSGPT